VWPLWPIRFISLAYRLTEAIKRKGHCPFLVFCAKLSLKITEALYYESPLTKGETMDILFYSLFAITLLGAIIAVGKLQFKKSER